MDKCPVCGADTRQGDNYCLNCGQRLLPSTPSGSSQQQAQSIGDATLAAADDWGAPVGPVNSSSGTSWSSDPAARTVGGVEVPTVREPSAALAPTAQATMDRIEQPARFILRSDSGEVLQEYLLDKEEVVIGRAPTSDILLSKDKLTSRRHAVVRYEHGQYVLHDEHSANGTFVNGQQLEDTTPYTLKDGDQVGIGEHELSFHGYGSNGAAVEDMPTVAVPYGTPPQELTYRTREDGMVTAPSSDDFGTYEIHTAQDLPVEPEAAVAQEAAPVIEDAMPAVALEEEAPVQTANATATASVFEESAPAVEPVISLPAFTGASEEKIAAAPVAYSSERADSTETTFQRLNNLPQPALPDMSVLMAAISALDGQVMSLQEQFNATQEAMRNRDGEIAQVASQLRTGIRRVAERMDNTIADVARSREALAWAELLQLMEDVMNNPRDIEYVTKLARKARELNKVFQIHQNVLNTMAECNSLLRAMIGENE